MNRSGVEMPVCKIYVTKDTEKLPRKFHRVGEIADTAVRSSKVLASSNKIRSSSRALAYYYYRVTNDSTLPNFPNFVRSTRPTTHQLQHESRISGPSAPA